MPANNPGDLKRILAIRLDNIGDMIMLSPALRTIHESFPSAELTLLASPGGAEVTPLLPWINEVIPVRAVWQEISPIARKDPEDEADLVKNIASRNFDAAFIFTSFSQSPYPPAFICYLANIPTRVGQSKEFGGVLLTHWLKSGDDATYQVDRNLDLLSYYGLPVNSNRLELHIPFDDQKAAVELIEQQGMTNKDQYILAAPGASAAARRYDPMRFAKVIDGISKIIGVPVLVLGSERERNLLEPFTEAAKENKLVHPIIGQTSVSVFAALIKRSLLVIANNSASIHVAEAFQRPMAILYSGTDHPIQWAPRYTPARIFSREVNCSPCYRFKCPFHMECLDLHPEEVIRETIVFMDMQGILSNSTSVHANQIEAVR